MKKRILAFCTALAMVITLLAGISDKAYAAESAVATLTASATTSAITVSGTVNTDIAAVMVEATNGETVLAKMSFAVMLDNTFSGTISNLSLTEGATYTVKAADYAGGTWKTETCTVPGGGTDPGTTTPTEDPAQPPVSDPTSDPSSGSETSSEPVTEPDITPVEEKTEAKVTTDDEGNPIADFEMGNLDEGKAEAVTGLNPENVADAELISDLLTEKEQKAVENGEEVSIIFEAEEKALDKKEKVILEDEIEKLEEIANTASEQDADIPEELKDAFARTPAPSDEEGGEAGFNFTVVGSYDFSVYKKVGDNTPEEVHDFGNSGIVVRFILPKNALNTNPLIKRLYYMIHMLSNGSTELLPVNYNENTNECEVAFKNCSTFTLVYTDVAYYVEEGTVINSSKHNAKYRVITSGDTAGTIGTLEYLGPRYMKKTHKIVTKVKIDNVLYKVTKIADNAFRDNTKVEKIYVGKYVTEIGDRAFYKCTGLKEITFAAKKLTKLGKLIFYKDKALEKVEIRSTRLKSANVGEKIFYAVNKDLKVVVPETKVSAYTKLFKDKKMTSGVAFEAIE